MLTADMIYCISSDDDDSSATTICLNRKNNFYNFSITNSNGNQINLQLNEILAGELFTALKNLGNFV